MSTPFLSQVRLFSFSFAPKGWALCNGQLLPINQNQALFSLLGTTYGGDGRVNFALPDLRGRVPMGVGGGHVLGEQSGSESAVVNTAKMPAHSHAINVTAVARCKNGAGNQVMPAGNVPAVEAPNRPPTYYDSALPPDANMNAGAIALGGSVTAADTGTSPVEAHPNTQPYLVLTYCIALQGIFPTQN